MARYGHGVWCGTVVDVVYWYNIIMMIRFLVDILCGKIAVCDMVCSWFAAAVAVVACFIDVLRFTVESRKRPCRKTTQNILQTARSDLARPFAYIANSLKRPCTAVCERRPTTSFTPLANRAERAMLL